MDCSGVRSSTLKLRVMGLKLMLSSSRLLNTSPAPHSRIPFSTSHSNANTNGHSRNQFMIMADPTFLNGSNQETSLVLSTTPITSRKECSKIDKALEEVTLMRVGDPKVNSHHQVAPFLSLLTPFTNVTVYSWQPDTHNPSLAFGRDRSLINQVQAGVINTSSYLLPAQGDRCLGEAKLAWCYSRSHHPETN